MYRGVFTTGSLEVRDSSNNLVFGVGDLHQNPILTGNGFDRIGLGSTTMTGSFELIPFAGSTVNILTGSLNSTGAKVGIGTSTASPPGTALALFGDLGLTDTAASKTIAMQASAGSLTMGSDGNNYGRFEYTDASNSVQIYSRVGGSTKSELMLSNNQVSVGKGAAASSGIDLEVAGTNKTVLIGDDANPPAGQAALFLGNQDTKIFHDTFLGGQLIIQSTSSIAVIGDRTIGASSSEFAYLKARNAASVGIAGREDVRVEAPGGLQIDNNLSLSGTLDSLGSNQTRATFAYEGSPRVDLLRIDGDIQGNEELGELSFMGSEDGGTTKVGGVSIRGVASNQWTGIDLTSKMEFYITKETTKTLGMTLTSGRDLQVGQKIKVGGNIIQNGSDETAMQFDSGATPTVNFSGKIKVTGNAIQDSGGNDVIAFDSNGDITTLAHRNVTDQVFFEREQTGADAGILNVFNTSNALPEEGGFIKLVTKHASILNGEAMGGIHFGAADTGVSSAPNNMASIIGKVDDAGYSMGVSQGSKISFETTAPGSNTPVQSHELSRSGLTGSIAGIKLLGGNLELSGVPEITRNGQGVRPGLYLPDYPSNDVAVYRVDASSAGHGYTLTYSGSGSGIDNKLELWADNTFTAANSQVMAYSIDQGGNVSIPNLIPGVVIGADPEDTSDDTRYDPNNPSVTIAGRREYIDIGFTRTTSDIPTKAILPAGPSAGTSEDDFTDADQSPEQWRYAWIAPCDGYIDAIQMLSDTAFGQSNSITVANMIDIDVYILTAAGASNLNSLSPDHTWGICYGWSSLGGTHAGDVMTWRLGETGNNLSLPSNRSDTQFSAGDKIWFAFDGGSNTNNAKFPDNTSNSGFARVNFKINIVLDERSMAT